MNSKLAYFFCLFCLTFSLAFSQNVGIGTTTPDASSILELNSTTLGFLVPRMTNVQKTAISAPATGLLIYQTDLPNGFWYYDGATWKQLTSVEKIDDLIDGKSDSDGSNDYSSVFLGFEAGRSDDQSDNQNVGVGYQVLYSNTTGYNNVISGYQAMYSNTTGNFNVSNGMQTLYSNTTGSANIAIGNQTMYYNTTGSLNNAIGTWTLGGNTTGRYNVAVGVNAMFSSQTGDANVAVGLQSLASNFSGDNNTGCGYKTLFNNGVGNLNSALGFEAFYTNSGYSNSTALGANTTITASNQVRVGDASVSSIGGYQNWTNISDVRFKKNVQYNVPGLAFINQLKPVTYNLDVEKINDFLGVNEKQNNTDELIEKVFKGNSTEEIEEMKKLMKTDDTNSKTDEFMFQSMKEKSEMLQTGFLAQDVEKAANALGYNFSGVDKPKNDKDHYGLRYAEFVVPLVKAVQELSQKNEQLNSKNTELENQLKKMEERIEALENNNNK